MEVSERQNIPLNIQHAACLYVATNLVYPYVLLSQRLLQYSGPMQKTKDTAVYIQQCIECVQRYVFEHRYAPPRSLCCPVGDVHDGLLFADNHGGVCVMCNVPS